MTASDRRVHEHLVRELQDPPGGVPSLEEARWEALRCYLKPVLTFLINQKWDQIKARNPHQGGPKARRAIGYSSYNPGPTRATLSWRKVSKLSFSFNWIDSQELCIVLNLYYTHFQSDPVLYAWWFWTMISISNSLYCSQWSKCDKCDQMFCFVQNFAIFLVTPEPFESKLIAREGQ